MGKLNNYIKRIEQTEKETLEVSKVLYLKNLRELAKLRYTVSKAKKTD